MSFLRPNQWYHSQADPIWPYGTFKRHRDYGNFLELFFYLQSRLLIRQRFLACMENRLKEYKHMFRYCK